MNSIDSVIDKSLELLEAQRKKSTGILKKNLLKILAALVLIGYYIFGFNQNLIPLFMFCIFGAIGFSIYLMVKKSNSFTKEYKDAFITPLMKNIFPELSYDAKQYIDEQLFKKSKLYSSFNRYSGDDYFSGSINGTPINFSELLVQYRSSGKNSNTRTIFKGVFATITANRSVTTTAITIKPNNTEAMAKVPSFLRKIIEKFIKDPGPKVETGDTHFDNKFFTFSESKNEVDSFLSNDLKEAIYMLLETSDIVNIASNLKAYETLSIKVEGNNIYVAIPTADIFPVNYFSTILTTKPKIEAYINLIKSVEGFVSKV